MAKVKVLTFADFIRALQMMVDTGLREGGEPYTVGGQPVSSVVDARTGRVVLEGSIERDVEEAEMFRKPWE